MNWNKITTLNITTATGEPDTIHFEREENGSFRIVNDYGSECITFDVMTGYEAISRIKEAFDFIINDELNSFFQVERNNIDDFSKTKTLNAEDCTGLD